MGQCSSLGTGPHGAEAAMRLVSAVTGPMRRVAQHPPPTLSRPAKTRLGWFDYYARHGRKVSLTCRHFGISRETFYRWQRRYSPADLRTLEARPSRPHRRRQIGRASCRERV